MKDEINNMKAVILAGGLGTRMQELTELIPKPMVEIGSKPALWHIMKIFSYYGVSNFNVALGYKGHIIKKFFTDYSTNQNSIRVDLSRDVIEELENNHEDWVVELIDTGPVTQTGGRIARMKKFIGDNRFFLTYGDGVSDIDLEALLEFHKKQGKIATVTAVRPPSKFGALGVREDGSVGQFTEKPKDGETWISGGFFVFEPEVFDYLSEDAECILERAPLENIAKDGMLSAFQHKGFWQCMDTVKDVDFLNSLWDEGRAPWKSW